MRDLFLGIDVHSMLALPKQARTRFRPSFLLPLLVYSLLKNSLVDLVEKRAKPCAIVIAILYIIVGLTGLLPDLRYAQVDTTRMAKAFVYTHKRNKAQRINLISKSEQIEGAGERTIRYAGREGGHSRASCRWSRGRRW